MPIAWTLIGISTEGDSSAKEPKCRNPFSSFVSDLFFSPFEIQNAESALSVA
jgi:hypothetical protein